MDSPSPKPQALPAIGQRFAYRLPQWGQILPVFSAIVFVVFSWTIYHLFWQMASWLYTMSLPDVLVLVAYILSFALLESLALLAVLLVLCLVFPPRTFKEKFTGQGVVLLALLSAGAILLQGRLELIPKLGLQALLAYILLGMAAVAIAILLLSWLMERAPSLPRLLSGLADRMTVFSFIYIPLSLAGWVVVILRNLF